MHYDISKNGCFWVIVQYLGDVQLAEFQTSGNIHSKITEIEKLWYSLSVEQQDEILLRKA